MEIFKLRLLPAFLMFFVLNCKQHEENSFDFNKLKAKEAQNTIQIEEKMFYSDKSIFKGSVSATKDEFALNISDQFNGQTIIAIKQLDWFRNLPLRYKIENNYNGKVMLGKIIDIGASKGLGYVMTEGVVTLEYLDGSKMILTIDGKGSQYGENGLKNTLVPFKGAIVFKEPTVVLDGINMKDIVNNKAY